MRTAPSATPTHSSHRACLLQAVVASKPLFLRQLLVLLDCPRVKSVCGTL
jgi:hypothetical protein